MAEKYYIGYSNGSLHHETKNLKNDVGTFAYVDHGSTSEVSDILLLNIGSHFIDLDSWSGVENAPLKLFYKGHLQVFPASPSYQKIEYSSFEIQDDETGNFCKSAILEKINGIWGKWTYLSNNSSQENDGSYLIPSYWINGLASDLSLKVWSKDYIDENASLNRGILNVGFDFNQILLPGFYNITLKNSFSSSGCLNYPPTEFFEGKLEVKSFGCTSLQYYYPYNTGYTGLYFRELDEFGNFSQWYSSTEGNMKKTSNIVEVPSYYVRGIPVGFTKVPVYNKDYIDVVTDPSKIRQYFTAGNAINISNEGVISWTGVAQSFSALAPIYINPSNQIYWNGTTDNVPEGSSRLYYSNSRVQSFSDTRYSLLGHTHAISEITGLQSALDGKINSSRTLTINGTANQIAVAGGSQDLTVNRIWSIGLSSIHTGFSGGSSSSTLTSLGVDVYGRVTSATFGSINFPVTSVNGQTGAVSLTTTNIPEGTNLYWTTARGDARYVLLTGSYNNPTFINSLDYSKITNIPSFLTQAYSTIQSNNTSLTQRNILNFSSEFSVVDNVTKTNVSINSVDWSKITNSPDFAGLYVPIVRTLTFSGSPRISITGGTQNLSSSRTWSLDLATIHAGLSGGSSITTPSIVVNSYGQVTSLSYSTILFPVTSVNGQTGAVLLNTDNISEGTTNLYFTNSRVQSFSDTRYSLLGHTHTWSSITGAPSFITQAYSTVQADTLPLPQRNNINFSQEFSVSDSSANNRTSIGISAIPYSKITGVPPFLLTETDPTVPSHVKSISSTQITNWDLAFGWGNHASMGYLTSFTETDPTVPSHVKNISLVNIANWNSKLSGSLTLNYIPKSTGVGTLGDSRIIDNGTNINVASNNTTGLFNVGGDTNIFGNLALGTNDAAGYRLRVNGAIYSDGDASAVAFYVPSGRAIRAQGTMNIDAGTSAPIYFRSNGGASYIMELNSNGKVRLNSYYSSTQWPGTPTSILGADSSGNIITLSTLLYADKIHGHSIGDITGLQSALDGKTPWGHDHDDRYYTKGQLNISAAGGQVHWDNITNKPSFSYNGHTHSISEITNLSSELSNRPTWGDVYTRYQLNTSGAGGQVHWDNIINKPNISYVGHTHSISEVINLQSALDGKTPWGHTHSISDITGLQSALDGKSNNGHTHDDRYPQYWSNSTISGYWSFNNGFSVFGIDSSDRFVVKSSGAGTQTVHNSMNVTGDFYCNGNVTAYSDSRLKTNIKNIPNALQIIENIGGYNFNWVDTGKSDIGVIAQEIEKYIPSVVKEFDGLKTVDYSRIVTVLIEAVKELSNQVKNLKSNGSSI